jgi:hypothetical protein
MSAKDIEELRELAKLADKDWPPKTFSLDAPDPRTPNNSPISPNFARFMLETLGIPLEEPKTKQ